MLHSHGLPCDLSLGSLILTIRRVMVTGVLRGSTARDGFTRHLPARVAVETAMQEGVASRSARGDTTARLYAHLIPCRPSTKSVCRVGWKVAVQIFIRRSIVVTPSFELRQTLGQRKKNGCGCSCFVSFEFLLLLSREATVDELPRKSGEF